MHGKPLLSCLVIFCAALAACEGSCSGASAALDPKQCAAFQDLFDSTGGATTWSDCSDKRDDPCGCGESSRYGHGIYCVGDSIVAM
jgi:hypothetical protein